MKKITFFKSAVCPRCYIARRELAKLQEEFSELEIEEIDVLSHPIESAKRGIFFVPALQANSQTLTMIFPRSANIRLFVENFYKEPDNGKS